MVAGVAYSSFAFKPLWHPPLVRNASFAIQNTIPMEYMKTLKFVFFLFTRQKPWKTHCGTKGKTHARCLWNRWFYGTLFPGVWVLIFNTNFVTCWVVARISNKTRVKTNTTKTTEGKTQQTKNTFHPAGTWEIFIRGRVVGWRMSLFYTKIHVTC